MGHYDSCREGYCAKCGAAPGNHYGGYCQFCQPKKFAAAKEAKEKRLQSLENKIVGHFKTRGELK